MAQVARRLMVCALLAAALGAVPVRSQDVAEAERHEREHKAAQAKTPRHVYTDEDLKRTRILTPEDGARVASHKTNPPAPQTQPQEQQPQVAAQPVETPSPMQQTPSLGEVARHYRAEKAARQAELAAKNNKEEKSRYPLALPNTTLAAPSPIVKPNAGSLREDELHSPKRPSLVPPPVASPSASARSRISPFAPRNPMAPLKSQPNASLAVVASSVRKEQVRPGDSWWRLAQRYLGKGSRWQELWRVNPGLSGDPNWLAAGTTVFVPADTVTRGSPPAPQITVRPGDTLWSLAREHLGCAQSWPVLAAANPTVTTYNLQIGAKLALPQNQRRGCVTARHLSAPNLR